MLETLRTIDNGGFGVNNAVKMMDESLIERLRTEERKARENARNPAFLPQEQWFWGIEARQYEDACQRLLDGTYGICAVCGQLISPERMERQPFAITCVPCAEMGASREE